ncbi:MAG: hypothetical protein IJI46_00545 [Erysipelotrichaceae bacterium]|nr:hypothetical protein [Erysipelotrichaceae bacterium]
MENINLRAMIAKNDDEEFSALVKDYQNFLLAEAYKNTGRYISISDDEHSIALSAFHEAILKYDASKGAFLSFAKKVISLRLTDFARKERKYKNIISIDDEEEESEEKRLIRNKELQIAEEKEAEKTRQDELRFEIEELREVLKEYGFSFFDLTKVSPKAEKTRQACGKAVVCILLDEKLYAYMAEKRELPMKQLEKQSGVPRKILDRHRKYIIAATEILKGDYPCLESYMNHIRKMKWEKEAER